jgi:acetyl-CoA synthetase (ADP-forming)
LLTKTNNGVALDFLFHPSSIVVVGVSPESKFKFNAGTLFIKALKEFGYPGDLYAVGTNAGEAVGQPIYASIRDIPGKVDYAISAIPSKFTPQLMEDCGQKGVKAVHFFTSGFGEIEDKQGEELQRRVIEIARKYGIRLIGPNCMGIYYPSGKLAFGHGFSQNPGSVGYLAQSGGQCILGIREANRRGIYFSKVISYGNAADINECDLIEYFISDTETEIITAYIEGTNHGRRLFRLLREAALKKPVIVFKCAATEGGSHAAVSHTSAIAGSSRTWDALLKQAGVIRVYNVKEMFDVVSVLQRCGEIRGLNTLVIGHGGGSCVQASDDTCRAGLKMPLLTAELRQALMGIYLTDAGNIFKNPLDINPFWGLEKSRAAFNAVAGWEGADIILLHATPEQDPFVRRDIQFRAQVDTLLEWAKLSAKPTIAALNVNTVSGDDGLPEQSFNRLSDAGIATFPSVARAATALYRVYQYNQWHLRQSR